MESWKNNPPIVLIVDDIPGNIQLVGNILRTQGYSVNFAKDGINAINHAKKIKYDLILLDIMMPEMSGFEVCEHLKSDPDTKDIPVVFLTAKDDAESVSKGFKLGGVDYITKPFNKDELISRVATHINLNRKNNELYELNNIKNRFLSIIAHDLKGPFNALMGFCDILSESLEFQDYNASKEVATYIADSVNHTYKLLENLLEWLRYHSDNVTFQPEKVIVSSLISDAVYSINPIACSKKINILEPLSKEIFVFVDKYMITTVIRNLLVNAIKYSYVGGKIEILTNIINPQNLLITIKDNGVGISNYNLHKLFDLTEKFSTSGTKNEKGTGLGLILCKELVEKNKGQIFVQSEEGVGSVFSFTLPLSV